MKAILQMTFVAEVDDEEAAATLAISMEQAAQLNMVSVREQYGVSEEDTARVFACLGAQVLIVPEEILA